MSKQFAFNSTPTVSIPRNKFDLSHTHKTTFDVGDLVPILVQEVYPGESFKDTTTFVCRSSSPFIRPVIDNLFLDTFYFFVPYRLVYNRFKEFMGENVNGYWANTDELELPQLDVVSVKEKSIANYIGVPQGDYVGNLKVCALPFRAYAMIYNEWFRDQNVQDPVLINFGDVANSLEEVGLNDDIFGNNGTYYLGDVAKVNKLHDYFTSALPSPQKGNAVEVPIQGISPVRTSDEDLITSGTNFPMNFRTSVSNNFLPNGSIFAIQNETRGGGEIYKSSLMYGDAGFENTEGSAYPSNLYTDYKDAQLFVNDLRYAFQIQKMLEKDARTGTRYREYLLSHFGVRSPDQTQQIPEYLGGNRQPLNIQQVAQTSQSDVNSPLGQVGAYSLSNGVSGFSKSFTEHGLIIGLACVRYKHSYQQGLEKYLTRKTKFDLYDPLFANIGEQPITKKEIYVHDDGLDNVFGYQEAWADLRYRPNKVSGALTTESGNGLDVWHFADFYSNSPILSSEFIEENPSFVDRTLSASQNVIPHFIFDFYFNLSAIRPMPLYSIPGLIDHH